jgi:hypothetical protein
MNPPPAMALLALVGFIISLFGVSASMNVHE